MPCRHVRFAGVLAIGFGLAACQAAPPKDAPTDTVESDAPAEPATDAPAGPGDTEAEPAPPDVAALPPEPAPPPEPVIDDNPDRLLGLDRTALGALLGEPALIRREAPAEIWQYRSATCVFDVFLYGAAGTHRVEYLEARDSMAQRIDTRACLNRLLRARMGLPLG